MSGVRKYPIHKTFYWINKRFGLKFANCCALKIHAELSLDMLKNNSNYANNFWFQDGRPFKEFGQRIGTSEHPSLYELRLKHRIINHADKIQKYELGKPGHGTAEKVLLVVGGIGSGKTTLINAMINNILGVEWESDFRFKLKPEGACHEGDMTNWLSSYTIHHQEGFRIPYTIRIIDTPGFGNRTSVLKDKEIAKQLQRFLSKQKDLQDGISHIDAVCLVAQSSQALLTPSQKYIFDFILSLFGKDVEDNILLVTTFADAQQPPILEALKGSKIPHKNWFKFNNASLFANTTAGDEALWKIGAQSFADLFSCVEKLKVTRYICLRIRPPLHVSLNNFVARPSFKNLRTVFLTKWPRMSKKCLHLKNDL